MSFLGCKQHKNCADGQQLGASQGQRNGHRAGLGEKRQMQAIVATGEDVDCSHCRCETWPRNEVGLNKARTNG